MCRGYIINMRLNGTIVCFLDKYQTVLFDWRFPQFLMTKRMLTKKFVIQGTELGVLEVEEQQIESNFEKISRAVNQYFKREEQRNAIVPGNFRENGITQ